MSTTIYSVEKIDFDSRNPGNGQIKIMATGQVNTGGWRNPSLERLRAKDENGFQMYRFVADAPDGIVTQAFEEVSATALIGDGEAKGVSIEAATNTLTKSFDPT